MSREFRFTDKDFTHIRKLVAEKTGIHLSEAKRDMVYSRLSRRLRALNLERFDHYCHLLKDDSHDEMVQFINAITTNLTAFFRENHHFEYLKNTVLPGLFHSKTDKRIRIWSAGCSTGEEPYSIAMTVSEAARAYKDWDIKILATDLDTNVVQKASSGVYTMQRVNGISNSLLQTYFQKSTDARSDEIRVVKSLRDMITFKPLNLMHDWPMKGPFDVIFCRNVVIYFDKPTQRILFDRYANLLSDNGHLFIGHSESLFKVSDRFKLIGGTMYQKQNGQPVEQQLRAGQG